jgi:hypothetical protein
MLSLRSPFCTERRKLPVQATVSLPVRARSQQLFYYLNYLVASARLALLLTIAHNMVLALVKIQCHCKVRD